MFDYLVLLELIDWILVFYYINVYVYVYVEKKISIKIVI